MQGLISWKDAVFGSTNFASLQADIIEQLIIQHAKMLLMTMETRPDIFLPPEKPRGEIEMREASNDV